MNGSIELFHNLERKEGGIDEMGCMSQRQEIEGQRGQRMKHEVGRVHRLNTLQVWNRSRKTRRRIGERERRDRLIEWPTDDRQRRDVNDIDFDSDAKSLLTHE